MVTAIETTKEEKAVTPIEKITTYLDAETVKARFAQIVGDKNVGAYVSSIMTTVANSAQLQKCTPNSIYISAVRAATMRLSTDPSTGQAYLVPFKGAATLVVGYKGLYDMAIRTGRYRYINVGQIYEGQTVELNQITGFHSIVGFRQGNKVIGWIGAFEMRTGFGKTIYMTIEEIHAHAKQYSASYDFADSPWKKETWKMEQKTVLRLLLRRWAYLDPADVQALEEVETAQAETIDAESSDIPDMYIPDRDEAVEEVKRTTEQNLKDLGY